MPVIRKSLVVPLLLGLVMACEGPVGPQGPAGAQGPAGTVGPQGPQGPAGVSVAYQVFEGAVTSTTMNTSVVNTGGVVPGIVCYISHSSSPGSWLTWDTNAPDGTACGIVQQGSTGYIGSAVFPSSFVNSGWTVRVVLFWLP